MNSKQKEALEKAMEKYEKNLILEMHGDMQFLDEKWDGELSPLNELSYEKMKESLGL